MLFWKAAKQALQNGRPREVQINCVEMNANNFTSLCGELEQLSYPGVTITATKAAFADEASRLATSLVQNGRKAPPTFWTADPYGFKGVPLTVIKQLMSIPRSEVLITFMVRDMRRFLEQENFEAPLNEFFGGDSWRQCVSQREAAQREECLLLRYADLIRADVARFATPFRVFEDERRQTLYYLVHLSNHPLGMRHMKKAMIKQSRDMTFWPVTVRPPDQLELDTSEQPPFPRLQKHLSETHGGESMTFEELLNSDYPTGFWLEPDYRSAVLAMEDRGVASVTRERATPTGRKPSGLKLGDRLSLALEQMPLA